MKFSFSAKIAWQAVEKFLRVLSVAVTSILITNQLGIEKFGSYSFIVNNLLIALALANFGTANFISSESASRDVDDSDVLGTFFCVRLFTSVFSALLVWVTSLYMEFKIDAIFIVFIITIIFSSLDVFENFNIGKDRYILNLKIKAIILIIGFGARIYCFFYNYDWYFYLIVLFAEYIFSYAVIAVETIRKLSVKWRYNILYLNTNLKNIITLSATSVLALLTVRFDQYLLKFMLGMEELGTYNFLFGFINVSTFMPLVVFYIKLPVLAQTRKLSLEHQKEHDIALRLFLMAGIVGSVVSIGLSSFIMFYYDFGRVYWFVILTLSFLPLVTASSLYQVILISIYDYKWLGFMKVLISALMVILIGPILVKITGLIGVSLSMIISLLFVEIFFIANVDKNLRGTYFRLRVLK